jgi:enamine deaminase RidA (YjgF/YER057c/UK114 family)
MTVLQPPGWPRPKGYANGIAVKGGTAVYIAGQVGWDSECRFAGAGFAAQFRQALANVLAVLNEAGGRPEHLVRLTWYVLDRAEYLASLEEVGAAWRELMGRHYPVMSVVEVKGLVERAARLEIEATAVISD